ncbi:MAG: NAD(P)/FAD-dependent oxidoreductase [Luteolibacter sp.]
MHSWWGGMLDRTLAVIGGGPAGLAAAEAAAREGIRVTLFDAKRSVGRKFLVAGKSGLNLTHGEPLVRFITRYQGTCEPSVPWADLLAETSPADVRTWALELGIETFQARTGRVYPAAMKAAPLLRRWIDRLRSLGVRMEMNHAWRSIEGGPPWRLEFGNGTRVEVDAAVFAMGGGSWPQTGSDGSWLKSFEALGVPCHALKPANCGWETSWPKSVLTAAEGLPIKNIEVSAAGQRVAGELLITRYGLEGGAIYQLGHALRGMAEPELCIDFKPTFSAEELIGKLGRQFGNPLPAAIRAWRLSPAAAALLATEDCKNAESLVGAAKAYSVPLSGPRPIAEAISSAGGLCWSALDPTLMIRAMPGCFVAGEMIDWEAPTGGYLLQGCFATGRHAGCRAAEWLKTRSYEPESESIPPVVCM